MIYPSNYFINLSKVNLGPCTCAFVVTSRHVLRQSVYFFLCLSVRPYLVLVGKASSPPIVYCCVQHGWNLTIVGLQGATSNTLDFCKNIEASSPYLRVSLLIVFVRRFPEEDLKLSESLISVSVQAGGFLRPISLSFSDLVAGLQIVQPLVWRCICELLLVH